MQLKSDCRQYGNAKYCTRRDRALEASQSERSETDHGAQSANRIVNVFFLLTKFLKLAKYPLFAQLGFRWNFYRKSIPISGYINQTNRESEFGRPFYQNQRKDFATLSFRLKKEFQIPELLFPHSQAPRIFLPLLTRLHLSVL